MKALSTADIIGNKLEIAAFTAQVSKIARRVFYYTGKAQESAQNVS